MIDQPLCSRRQFIRTVGATGALAMVPIGAIAQEQPTDTQILMDLPFTLGLQSYSLRKFSLEEVLKKTAQLGLHAVEFYPGHLPLDLSTEKAAEMKAKFTEARIDLPSYGVVGFNADEAKSRKTFEFAREFGIKTLTADPSPDSFSGLDRLVEEFDIRVAIHNHGPGSRYSTVDDVMGVVADHHPNIGACVDTGHFLRSRVDPVKAVYRLGSRVHAVHLKDIRSYDDHTNVVNGRGILDLPATLAALAEIRFTGHMAIEYEADPEDPVSAIADCVAEVMKVVRVWENPKPTR